MNNIIRIQGNKLFEFSEIIWFGHQDFSFGDRRKLLGHDYWRTFCVINTTGAGSSVQIGVTIQHSRGEPSMSGKKGVLAFLVGQKNALKVVQYLGQHYNEISQFKVVVTVTEGKELDALGNMEWLSYVSSLKDGGAAEIAKRCSKKQIQAVFILNPSSLVHPKQFPAEKLMDLLDTCWTSNTYVCVNMEAIDLVLNQLLNAEGVYWQTFD